MTASFMRFAPKPIGPRSPAVPNARRPLNRSSKSATASASPEAAAATRASVASRVSAQGSHAAMRDAMAPGEGSPEEAAVDAAIVKTRVRKAPFTCPGKARDDRVPAAIASSRARQSPVAASCVSASRACADVRASPCQRSPPVRKFSSRRRLHAGSIAVGEAGDGLQAEAELFAAAGPAIRDQLGPWQQWFRLRGGLVREVPFRGAVCACGADLNVNKRAGEAQASGERRRPGPDACNGRNGAAFDKRCPALGRD